MKHIKLEDLDFSSLSSGEQKALVSMLSRGPLSWKLGLFWGLSLCFGIFVYLFKGEPLSSNSITFVLIKAAIFIVLAIWARSWSMVAAIFLLGWHICSNAQLILSKSIESKVIYIGFAIVYIMGAAGCHARKQLLEKAQQT